jgi:hypothetical protein
MLASNGTPAPSQGRYDRLPRRLAAVHAHVEALDSFVLSEHICPDLIKQQIDRAPLGVV